MGGVTLGSKTHELTYSKYHNDFILWMATIKMLRLSSTNLVLKNSIGSNNLFEEMLSNMRVHSGQGIVQQEDVRLAVRCPGQAHTLLLTT